MQIGQAAKATGVSAKMIRHYEAIGLVPNADRRDNAYRSYSREDLHRLQFIRRARDLGFSFEQIRELLRLWSDKERSNAEVKAIALAHVSELERKAAQLHDMAVTLQQLASACDGSGRPDCPIIQGLEGHEAVAARKNAPVRPGHELAAPTCASSGSPRPASSSGTAG